MAVLTIDAMPPDALARLRELSQRQGKTLDIVAAELLASVLQTETRTRAALARGIRNLTPQDVPQTDSTEIIRTLRDG